MSHLRSFSSSSRSSALKTGQWGLGTKHSFWAIEISLQSGPNDQIISTENTWTSHKHWTIIFYSKRTHRTIVTLLIIIYRLWVFTNWDKKKSEGFWPSIFFQNIFSPSFQVTKNKPTDYVSSLWLHATIKGSEDLHQSRQDNLICWKSTQRHLSVQLKRFSTRSINTFKYDWKSPILDWANHNPGLYF